MNGTQADDFTVTIVAAARDVSFARRLQTQLKQFTLPKRLAGQEGRDGIVRARVDTVFLSLETPLTSDDAHRALAARYCIVVCSPNAVASTEVDDWVRRYASGRGHSHILCCIIDGEPNAADGPDENRPEAFPKAVRFQVNAQGRLTSERTEPIAADYRPQGDGPKDGFMKLIAGVFAVRYADLKQRERKRKQLRLASVCSAFVGLAVFGGYFWWLQENAAAQLRQKNYDAAIQEAFNARNNGQPDKESKAARNAGRLVTEGVENTRLSALYAFRKRHDTPGVTRPYPGVETRRLHLNGERTVAAGLSVRDSRVFIQTYTDGQAKEFALPQDVAGIVEVLSPKDKSLVRSVDVEDVGKVWFLTGTARQWQVNRLDPRSGKTRTFETRSQSLKPQFANRMPALNSDGYNALLSGWVAYETKDDLVLEDFESGEKFVLPRTDATAAAGSEMIWFSAKTRQAVIGRKDGCNFVRWTLRPNKTEPLDLCGTGFESVHSDSELTWLIATYKPDGGSAYSKLVDLRDGRVLTVPEVNLLGFVGQTSDFIFRGELSRTLNWGLVKLDPENGRQVWRTENARWHTGVGKFKDAFYRQTEAGDVIKHSAGTGVELQRFQTGCAKQLSLDAQGKLHCLDHDNQWVIHDAGSFSPQLSLTVSQDPVHDVEQVDGGLLVVSNGKKSSSLSRVITGNAELVKSAELKITKHCLGQLMPTVDQQVFLSATSRGNGAGYLDVLGKSCVHKDNPINLLVQHGDTLKILEQSVFNPALVGRLSVIPNQAIDGVFAAKHQLSWFIDQSGTRLLESDLKQLALPEGWNLVGISTSASRAVAAISLLREKPTVIKKLVLFDLENNVEQEVLDEQKLPDLTSKPLFYQHGVSPDGNHMWWTEAFQAKSKIRWHAFDGSGVPAEFPKQTETRAFQLLYSASGRHLLQVNTGDGFQHHKVMDVSSGATVWEGDGFNDVAFHVTQPYLRFGHTAYDLTDGATELSIVYPDDVKLHAFHPRRPWAAGTCGGNVCIVDLPSRLVIFLNRRRPDSQPISQIQFGKDGASLTYLLDGNTIVRHPIDIGANEF